MHPIGVDSLEPIREGILKISEPVLLEAMACPPAPTLLIRTSLRAETPMS
jgi:hypothetical protein